MGRLAHGSVAGWQPESSGGGVGLRLASSTLRSPRGSAVETALGPSWSGVTPASARGPAARPPAGPGRRLGPYRLVERIGRGRQADVWQAVHEGPPDSEVALKVLPAAHLGHDPRRLAQLRHEAERGARLVGPALVPAFDYGEDRGWFYLAMPLVRGCTLAAVIDQRRARLCGDRDAPPTPAHPLASARPADYVRSVAAVVARVARAAAAAHAANVVHRDIKPMNILLSHDLPIGRGAGAGVFLCDFGLARDLDVATPRQMRDGAGSPLYMAPERLRKRPADEVRCDVYALGVTLFEALTLTPPVEVPPDLPPPLWANYLASAVPRRALEVDPAIPPALAAAAHRAMDRDPAHRQPTASAFADDLDRFLARDESRRRRLGGHAWDRRHHGYLH